MRDPESKSAERRPRERRRRTTRPSVILIERLARFFITVGGIGTTVAVGLICVFLLAVVVPLFGGARVRGTSVLRAAQSGAVHLAADEYDSTLLSVDARGGLAAWRADTGDLLAERPGALGEPTAQSFPAVQGDLAFGYADGTIRLGRVGFEIEYLDEAPAGAGKPAVGDVLALEGALIEFTPSQQFRALRPSLTLAEPLPIAAGAALVRVDVARGPWGLAVATFDAAGRLVLSKIREKQNLLTGAVTRTVTEKELPYRPSGRSSPDFLVLSDLGDQVFLAWKNGELLRFDLRAAEPRLAETLDLVSEPGAELTVLELLLGGATLVSGDSLGRVRTWFRVEAEDAHSQDGSTLVQVQELAAGSAPVTDLATSSRSRVVAAAHADGTVEIYQATTGERLLSLRSELESIERLVLSPKETALFAAHGERVQRWDLDLAHHQASLRSLFGSLWYEGEPEPSAHVWQSTGGSDGFEPKLGLRVLVFGTIKGTLYSLLFGAPIAILAAIYTSEFLEARLRSPVKSVIELMAGLPSVVLGFLAGVVIAPLVQQRLAAVLVVFLTAPVSILVGAQLWSALPKRWRLRLQGWPRLTAVGAAILCGCLVPVWLGPPVERALFAGDMEAWLDGRVGTATGGFLFLLLPVCGALAFLGGLRWLDPWLRAVTAAASEPRIRLVRLARFGALASLTVGLAWTTSWCLGRLGFDLRGHVLGTYVQRNALVVGFIMGFAIIPIVYTLAEDALSSVPGHLRLASLGCGATPWQTAVRVIIPTASSGILSALMIGLGRAVGETMIVLMATGNTPVRDWNVFNGFRTLSANIAVELPEAVRGDTHYLTLFLAALTLFAMTFVLNTFAERLRSRSRKRAFQL